MICMLCALICVSLYLWKRLDIYVYFVLFFLILSAGFNFLNKKPTSKAIVTKEHYETLTSQIIIAGMDTIFFNKAYESTGVKIKTVHYESNDPDTITIIVY